MSTILSIPRTDLLVKRYRAIFLAEASIRKITFEALSMEEAHRLAAAWGFGLEGEESDDAADTWR